MLETLIFVISPILLFVRLWMYYNYKNYIYNRKSVSIFEIINYPKNFKQLWILMFVMLPVKVRNEKWIYGYFVNIITIILYMLIILMFLLIIF